MTCCRDHGNEDKIFIWLDNVSFSSLFQLNKALKEGTQDEIPSTKPWQQRLVNPDPEAKNTLSLTMEVKLYFYLHALTMKVVREHTIRELQPHGNEVM